MQIIRLTLAIASLLFTIPLWVGCQQQKQQRQSITQDDLIEANRNLINKDAETIKNYIRNNNLNFIETKTGLWYNIENQGTGELIKSGNIVKLNYEVLLLDGTLCYSSKTNGPKEFLVGHGGVESGLEEAILILRKGAKAQIILPPYLAHGLVGDDNKIPAQSTIRYNIEIIDIK